MRTIAAKLIRIYLVLAISVLFTPSLIAQLYLYHQARSVEHEAYGHLKVAMSVSVRQPIRRRHSDRT